MGLEFYVNSAVFERDLPASAFNCLEYRRVTPPGPTFAFLMSWLLADSFVHL